MHPCYMLQVGVIDFPNLDFETTNVEFGSCLSDTTRRIPVNITNTSNVDVVYTWAWDKESMKEDVNSIASMSLKQQVGIDILQENPHLWLVWDLCCILSNVP